jgi:hypothetical protein
MLLLHSIRLALMYMTLSLGYILQESKSKYASHHELAIRANVEVFDNRQWKT